MIKTAYFSVGLYVFKIVLYYDRCLPVKNILLVCDPAQQNLNIYIGFEGENRASQKSVVKK